MNKKIGWILTVIQSIVMFIFVLWFRYYKYDIENTLTFFLMPFAYIGLSGIQVLSFLISACYTIFSIRKMSFKRCVPWMINLFFQVVLLWGFTEERVEEFRFDLYLNRRNQVVSDIENAKLNVDNEGNIDVSGDDYYKNLSINDKVRILRFGEEKYVWFYTSILMEGESTGYFYPIEVSDKFVSGEVELYIKERYSDGWYKGTMIED